MDYTGYKPGGLFTYGLCDGYPEAVLRGFKLGLLTQSDYNDFNQCDTIEDFKIHLQTTSYSEFFGNHQVMNASEIGERCTAKLVSDFEHIYSLAVPPLSTFLDYIRKGYMIDNVVFLITGTMHNRNPDYLKEKCHPLGVFEGMYSISFDHSLADLYNILLIDTLLAPYIQKCLSVEDLSELNIQIIRNMLYKAYLEDFHDFCLKLGGDSAEDMNELLSFDADRRSINITLNSFGKELQSDFKFKLYPNFGLLYPEGHYRFKTADDPEQVKNIVEFCPPYRDLFFESYGNEEKTLEDVFFEYEVKINRQCFSRLNSYAAFYSYFKLKEQEIRNIVWIAECIIQGQKQKMNQFIPVV